MFGFMKRKAISLLVVLALICTISGGASPISSKRALAETPTDSDLIVYDGFDGNLGGLSGQDTGYGFANKNDFEGGTQASYTISNSDPMKFPLLYSTPKYLSNNGGYRSGRGFDINAFNQAGYVNNGYIGKNGTTLWMSMLMKVNSTGDSTINLHTGNGFWENRQIKMGWGSYQEIRANETGTANYRVLQKGSNKEDGRRYWGLQLSTKKDHENYDGTGSETWVGDPVVTNKVVKPDETVFVVVKMEFDNTTKLSMYLNPDLAKGVPNVPDAVATTDLDPGFKGFSIHNGGSFAMDEMRMGKTYEAVTPLSTNKVPVTKIKLTPANGDISTLADGTIVGSNVGPTSGFETIATVSSQPAGNTLELTADNSKAYQYVKYYGAPGTYGQIAEIEYYNYNRKISGEPFGTVPEAGHEPDKAFDGLADTYFIGQQPDDQYIGLDLGGDLNCAQPKADVQEGRYESPIDIVLTTETEGADIYYTLDGSIPSATNGTKYTSPIHIDQGQAVIIKAISVMDGKVDSDMLMLGYGIGVTPPMVKSLRTYHLGNSLTDTLNTWVKTIANNAGYNHQYFRHTIPGAPTRWILDHPSDGFGNTWINGNTGLYAVEEIAPLDVIACQPFVDNSGRGQVEITAEKEVYEKAREYNDHGNLRFLVYGQWPDLRNMNAKMPGYTTDYEEIRQAMDDAYTDDQTVDIIPSGLSLMKLKEMIEKGEYPGATDFVQYLAENPAANDYLHLKVPGAYLVSLTAFAVMYKQSPVGRVNTWPSELTQEQALILQNIAWDVCTEYKYSGVYGAIDIPDPTATPATPTPTSTATQTATTTPTAIEETPTPTVTEKPTATLKPIVNKTAYVPVSKVKISKVKGTVKAKSKLTVYKKASTKKGRITKIGKGKKLTVKSVNGLYAKVKVGKKYGYVKVTSLTFSSKQNAQILAATRAYKAASTSKGYYKALSKNSKITLNSRYNSYYRITVRGRY